MAQGATLRGMTWNHPRGYEPLEAAADLWRRNTGTRIEWDRRSLQDFEAYPVEDLARRYDLIVIDHPHVGEIADAGCLTPIEGALGDIAAGSVGGSFESYWWNGRQWALPIDAAAQVQAWVPGRLPAPLKSWNGVQELAQSGRLALPLRPPHSLMSLFTLCGLLGLKLDTGRRELFPVGAEAAVELLAALAASTADSMYDMDPIAVLELMAQPDSAIAAAPLIYGYVSYAVEGFRDTRIAFADIPALDEAGPRGSALGGTGIAVSAYSDDPQAALAFAKWVASGEVQRDLFSENGGQPAHAEAWEADGVNTPVLDFYRATRRTLDTSWLRPRHAGYMAFQQEASELLNEALKRGDAAGAIVETLNARYRESR
ncbi:integral membrane protein [Pacificimonas flava]|uniref:Integral membrane protein n=2 Tax=Pacificimonas flava TaxID=1234595 RepID=M2U8Y1_9SPHN|nr:integral membrane protein [Pacificimonas flava]